MYGFSTREISPFRINSFPRFLNFACNPRSHRNRLAIKANEIHQSQKTSKQNNMCHSTDAHRAFANDFARAKPAETSETSLANEAGAQRRPVSLSPPPPRSFIRRQPNGVACKTSTSSQANRSSQDSDFIKLARRSVCEQAYTSDLCPVGSVAAQESLWAAVEDLFLQK